MIGKLAVTGFAAIVCVAPLHSLSAQSAAEWLTRGNTAYDARDAGEAVADYEKALAVEPGNYEALWRIARGQVDLAQAEPDADRRAAMYRTAQEQATRAVAANPNGADGHFVLAESLGRMAQTMGSRDRVKYAGKVRDQAMECLRLDSKSAPCLHVMGVWNAEIMRLNGFARMIARNFLGGSVFSEASWANARRYLEQAVSLEPRRIVHRLDLARVYADMGLTAQARTEYQSVIAGEVIDYNDPRYKTEAAAELKKLG
ncbi:MAG: hypothetical protein M3R65_11020 [Gemmatimonadota bacterium]|nr:hypothetical protein [Gemmatimonadota bacterium]